MRPSLRPSAFVFHLVEILDEEIDKCPDLGRHVLPVLVGDIYLQPRQIPVVENRRAAGRGKEEIAQLRNPPSRRLPRASFPALSCPISDQSRTNSLASTQPSQKRHGSGEIG